MPRARTARSVAKDMEREYRDIKQKMEKAMAKCTEGSAAYLNHLRALADLGRSHRDELAARGVYPVDLGVATKKSYVFRATIAGGTPVVESAEDAEIRRRLNEEYGDVPAAKKEHEGDEDGTEGSGSAPAAAPAPQPEEKRSVPVTQWRGI